MHGKIHKINESDLPLGFYLFPLLTKQKQEHLKWIITTFSNKKSVGVDLKICNYSGYIQKSGFFMSCAQFFKEDF